MKVATAEDASSAPVAAQAFEVIVPEGVTLPALEDLAAPDATSPASPEADPARTPRAPSSPAPTATPGQPASQRERELLAARNEERSKRKRLADQHRALQAEYDKLASRPRTTPLRRETPEHRKARLQGLRGTVDVADLKKKAEAADSVGQVAELVVSRLLDHLDERHTDVLEELDARDQSFATQIDSARAEVDEKLFRRDHKDYDEVCRRTGIFDALSVLPNGQFRDPVVAKQVYTSKNYAEAAYELAQQKLAYEAEEAEARGETPPAPSTDPAAPGARTVAPPADPLEAAERRGRQQAFDAMANTGNHAPGIRNLPPAGNQRRAQISKPYLDELSTRKPQAFLALMQANPDLERWYYSDGD